MLERYIDLERDIDAALTRFIMRVADEYAPIMNEIQTYQIFEGDKTVMIRENGDIEETKIHEAGTEQEIPNETILYGSLQKLADAFRPVGESMANDKERMMFKAMNEVTKKTGNVVDGKGRPFSHELLLEVLERIQIDFDENERPKMPTMVVSPSLGERIQKLMKEQEKPEIQRRFDEVLSKKKVEWREREADRTLVG